jgi:hypothetical protein
VGGEGPLTRPFGPTSPPRERWNPQHSPAGLDQGVEGEADAFDVAQVFVGDNPGFEIDGEGGGEDVDEAGVALAEARVANTDAHAGADGGQLADIAVAAKGKVLALQRDALFAIG